MGYDLHIKRTDPNGGLQPITLAEWRAALDGLPGVRPAANSRSEITNPQTGEVISVAGSDGDLEVLFPTGEWIRAIHWNEGSATIASRSLALEPTDPVWVAASTLATRLKASIRGDDGEEYDPLTGDIDREAVTVERRRRWSWGRLFRRR